MTVPSLASRLRTTRPMAQLRAGRRDWYSIKTVAAEGETPASAEIMIYEEIGYFGVTAADFATELKALDVPQIDVRINSPGGEVWDGLAIYNALRDHPAAVTTHVDGIAASAASIILQAGDNRLAAKASQVMIHEGWGIEIGGAEEMRAMADRLDMTNEMLAEIYADRAGGSAEDWRTAMRAETWYTGTEAATAGLVDAVDGVTADGNAEDDKMAASFDLSVFCFAGRREAPAPPAVKTPAPALANWDGGMFKRAVKEALA